MKMIVVFVVVIGLLAAAPILIRWIQRQIGIAEPVPKGADGFPYSGKPLFSPAEAHFLKSLDAAIGAELRVFAKVRLADLIEVRRGTPGWQAFHNKIDRKHIDFVVCNRATLQPLILLELDDSSHGRPDRKERDLFVDSAVKAAGMPLVHLRAAAEYSPQAILQSLREAMNGHGAASAEPRRQAAASK